ncbi:pilus assembly protein TadG-related protein [Streptomyces vastus]|uniref:Putative Flp pilus-assembly TadG-like N-terminal domain-containing protein n=1 Tax=Streptomyces vastus TaxID=285451 RepID=A0ABP6E6G5_9ACTN
MKRRVRAHLAQVRARMAAGDDRGQVTAFVVGVFAALWLFAGIVVDGGLALAGKARALDVAQEAARIGAQQLDVGRLRRGGDVRLVRDKAAAAARAHVASTGDSGTASVKGDVVTVRVTHHQRTQILQLIGLRTLTVHASGTAHAQRATP